MLKKKKKQLGFTLIELLVVIAIIGILASVVLVNLSGAREKAKVAISGKQQRRMTIAVELYYDDMGFYPPDVNRGWDPGLVKPLPWSPDEGTTDPPSGTYSDPGTDCSHCPSNWQTSVQNNWSGPYLQRWPRYTPWKGKYDYNYWTTETNRDGCILQPGIYIGVEGDYQDDHTIPEDSEEMMINKGFDEEACLNNESQMLLWPL